MDIDLCRNNLKNNKICDKYNVSNIFISDSEYANKKLSKLSYILNICLLFVNNNTIKNNKPFINKIRNEIYETTNEKLTNLEIFNIMKELSKHKEQIKNFTKKNNKIDDNYYLTINQNGGFISSLLEWYPDTKKTTKVLDIIDLLLDIAGFIPGAGLPIDAVGALLSLIRGRYIDGIFSLINMIPLFGSFIGTPGKYIRKVILYNKTIKKLKKMDDAYRTMKKIKKVNDDYEIVKTEDIPYNETVQSFALEHKLGLK